MIALWMLRAIAGSVLLALAAAAADRGCRLARRPTRHLWIGALAASLVLPWLGAPGGGADVTSAPAAAPGPTAAALPPRSDGGAPVGDRLADGLRALDLPLLTLWALAAAFALARAGIGATSVARRRREWTESEVDGVPVLLSHDFGPAVVGVMRWSIVLPGWVQRLDPRQRAMVLAHEMAHLRARDPALLHLAEVATALAPWNPVLWYLLRRVRLAVEMDCDARVLKGRRRSEAHAYGALLLQVGERVLPGPVWSAAMAEPFSSLERRIVALTDRMTRAPRAPRSRLALHGLVSVGLATGACVAPGVPFAPSIKRGGAPLADVPPPMAVAASDQEPAPATRVDLAAHPEVRRAAAPPRRQGVARAPGGSGGPSVATRLSSRVARELPRTRPVLQPDPSSVEIRAALHPHPAEPESRGGPMLPRDEPDPFTLRARMDPRYDGPGFDPIALRDTLSGPDGRTWRRAPASTGRPRGTPPIPREPFTRPAGMDARYNRPGPDPIAIRDSLFGRDHRLRSRRVPGFAEPSRGTPRSAPVLHPDADPLRRRAASLSTSREIRRITL